MREKIFILAVPVIFLLVSLLTLKDYGISWDEPLHFHRGQAYLHYFLTGEKTFKNLKVPASYYQADSLSTEWFLQHDGGHPPINDILAAFANFIFYQKLGLLGDIESHHFFNILASTLLVFVVTVFAYQTYGTFAGVISGLLLSLYPLFFAESRFNIKDPPEAAFFALTIWAFWMSLKKGSWKWLLLSVLGFSLALGTKFNILFLPIIIGPYLLVRYFGTLRKGWSQVLANVKDIPRAWLFTLLVSPLIVGAIFFAFWPFLWQDPLGNFLEITKFYKGIGTGYNYQQPSFYFGGFNAYPVFWILVTTPPLILLLTALGIFYTFRHWKEKGAVCLLWLLWFLVPIARVTVPSTSVYGGVRQIMEYIPAMALLAGLGAKQMVTWLHGYMVKLQKPYSLLTIQLLSVLITFAFLIYPIVKLHPNQNVYFNSFIGGLSGAKENNIPYWGNSFGNAYWQAIQWLNENAEPNARLALVQGTALNVPSIMLREDITRWNVYWSGIKREGEYLMELTHNDPIRAYPYAWDYVDKFLEPVYEVKVDGVAIAKVWKNDLEHTKPEMRLREVAYNGRVDSFKEDNVLGASVVDKVLLSRIVITYSEDAGCGPVSGEVQSSSDGESWYQEPERVPFPQINEKESVDAGRMQYFFPAREARAVRFIADSTNSCILENPQIKIFVLK